MEASQVVKVLKSKGFTAVLSDDDMVLVIFNHIADIVEVMEVQMALPSHYDHLITENNGKIEVFCPF